jgi:hypothetical protein
MGREQGIIIGIVYGANGQKCDLGLSFQYIGTYNGRAGYWTGIEDRNFPLAILAFLQSRMGSDGYLGDGTTLYVLHRSLLHFSFRG